MARPPVLLLCSQPLFEARGSPLRVRATLGALAGGGWAVTAVTVPVGPEVDLPAAVRLVRVRNWLGVRSLSIGPSFAKLLFGFFIALRAFLLGLRRRPRVVHGIEEMGLWAWALARLFRARLVYEKHSDPASYRKDRTGLRNGIMRLYARVERFVCRRADGVIATGPGLAAQARGYGATGRVEAIADVPSSEREADPDRVRAWRSRLDPRGDRVLFLYVGSFAAYQGVPLLLEAYPRAFSEEERLRLVLVGGGAAPEVLREPAVAALPEGALRHLPAVPPEDLPDLLAAVDGLVSPRLLGNNTPLKVLDYLKAGRAILATATEANELVLSADTARLVPATAEGLAAGMVELARDPQARSLLGQRGRELFTVHYGHARFREALGAFYRPWDPHGQGTGNEEA